MADRSIYDTIAYKRLMAAGAAQRPTLVAGLGDSQTQNCTVNSSPTSRLYYNQGYLSEYRSLSMQRIQFPVEYNKGIGGQSTDQIIPRLATDILTLNPLPDMVWINAGSNPGTGNTWTLLAGAIKQANEAGVLPVIVAPVPKASQSATERSAHMAQIEWLRGMAAGRKDLLTAAGLTDQNIFVVVNANRYITDYTSTTSAPLAGMLGDGLHYAPPAAFMIGREGARLLHPPALSLFDPTFTHDLRDIYIAGTGGALNVAPNGSLISGLAGIMQGTAGTKAADTFTGATYDAASVVSTDLTYRRWSGNSTANVLLSKVPKRDTGMNGTRQRIDVSVSAAAASSPQALDQYRFTAQIPAASQTPGDYLYAEVEVEMISNTKLRSIECSIGNATDGKQTGYPMTTVPHVRKLRTPPWLVGSSPAAVNAEISVFLEGVAGAQASVAFDQFVVRKCGALG